MSVLYASLPFTFKMLNLWLCVISHWITKKNDKTKRLVKGVIVEYVQMVNITAALC